MTPLVPRSRSSHRLTRLAFATLFALLVPAAGATDYYLGTSSPTQPGVPLASIADLNSRVLRPGDRVLFQGGETFAGTIALNAEDSGTVMHPVIITSFGSGRATIQAGTQSAIKIYNASGFAISQIDLIGAGPGTSTASGIDASVCRADSTKLPYLRFSEMQISGFQNGVVLGAWSSTSVPSFPGFADVKMIALDVFNNRSEGIKTWGTWVANSDGSQHSHTDVTISHCTVSDNRGDPTSTSHTGSGIILSGVEGGTIEYCVVHDNGGNGPGTGGGPFGIWAWESRRITLQYNLVYNQKSSSSLDGGAYDLDGGCADCTVQYNYSYNNQGPAIGVIQFHNASLLSNSVIRYNISQNDCRKTTQGIVYVGNFSGTYGINGAEVYGNTFFVSTNPNGGKPPVVSVQNQTGIANVRFRNNIFYASHTGTLIAGTTTNPSKALYQGNNYWGGVFDLTAFRASGQETLLGLPTGSRIDPQLQSPGAGGLLTDASLLPTLTGYLLKATSPLIGAGLNLTGLFGLNPGTHDFFGSASTVLDVGAAAYGSAPPPPLPIIPVSSVLIDDQFNGTGSLAGRAPDTVSTAGQKWIIQTGTGTIANGLASSNTTLRAVIDASIADATIDTSIQLTTSETGVILRFSDGSNYLRLVLSTSSVTLQKTQAGVTSAIASTPINLPLGQTYLLRITASGSTIAVSVNGKALPVFSTAFNQTATRFGLLAVNSGVRRWERFTISR